MQLKVFSGETFKDCQKGFNFWMDQNESATIHNVSFHSRDGRPAEISILFSYAPAVDQAPRIIPVNIPPGRQKI